MIIPGHSSIEFASFVHRHFWCCRWGVYPATKPALGPSAVATRRALGGLSLSGLGALLGGEASTAMGDAVILVENDGNESKLIVQIPKQ